MTSRPMRVLAITSHPIQYQAPWFRALARDPALDFQVLFLRLPDASQQGVGFGRSFQWDVPLADGYRWQSLCAVAETPGIVREAWRLWRCLRSHTPEALLLTGWHSRGLLLATLIGRVLGIPMVVRGESNALRPRRFLQRLFHRLLLRLYDRYLAIGQSSAAFYRGYSIPPARVTLARYGVDNARFDAQRTDLLDQRSSLRTRFAVADQVCFLFVGKLEPKKQPLVFLQALALALKENKEIAGLVVGEGPLSESLRNFARAEKLPVHFAGFLNQSEIAKAYLAADVLVLPSDHGETWGLVVNEAMLFEHPAIVSDRVGCGPDLVEDGVTGFRVPFGEIEALARAMLRFFEDRQLLLDCGRRARERVLRDYSIEQAASGTLRALLDLHDATPWR